MLVSRVLLSGFAIGARVSFIWQHTRLLRNVSEDASTRCMAVCNSNGIRPWMRTVRDDVVIYVMLHRRSLISHAG